MASEILRGTAGAEGGESIRENTAAAVDHPWVFPGTTGTSADPANPNVVEEKEAASGGVTAEEHLKAQGTARAKRDAKHRAASMVEEVQADVEKSEHVSGEASSSNSLEAQDEQEEQEDHVRKEPVMSGTFTTVLSMHMRCVVLHSSNVLLSTTQRPRCFLCVDKPVRHWFVAVMGKPDDVKERRKRLLEEDVELFKNLPFYIKEPASQYAVTSYDFVLCCG